MCLLATIFIPFIVLVDEFSVLHGALLELNGMDAQLLEEEERWTPVFSG